MEKEYLVKTQGYIITDKSENYIINAENEEKARVQAENIFKNDYVLVDDNINFSIECRKDRYLLISALGLFIAVVFAYLDWYNNLEVFSMRPHLLTTIYGTIFYTSFIVRFKGIKNVFLSKFDLIISVLMILVISSLFEIILGSHEVEFLFFKATIDPNIIIILALVLSWLGMKIVSVGCYFFVAILTLNNIFNLSVAMGPICGPLFIILTYVSIGIYVACDPALLNVFPSIFNASKKGVNYLNNDFNAAKIGLYKVKDDVIKRSIRSED